MLKNLSFAVKIFNNFAGIVKIKLKFLVGYQRRFSETVNKFHKIIKKIKQINVVINSYLPDWHKYENFRNMCLEYYELDPAHYYTLPNFGWDAMLLKTGVNLELIHDLEMYEMVEKG